MVALLPRETDPELEQLGWRWVWKGSDKISHDSSFRISGVRRATSEGFRIGFICSSLGASNDNLLAGLFMGMVAS